MWFWKEISAQRISGKKIDQTARIKAIEWTRGIGKDRLQSREIVLQTVSIVWEENNRKEKKNTILEPK